MNRNARRIWPYKHNGSTSVLRIMKLLVAIDVVVVCNTSHFDVPTFKKNGKIFTPYLFSYDRLFSS